MQEGNKDQEGRGSAKKIDEKALFRTLDEIDASSDTLNKATDSLRSHVNALCSSYVRSFRDHPLSEADELCHALKEAGYASVTLEGDTVLAKGRIYKSLENTGLEYQGQSPIFEDVDGGKHTRYYIGFGRTGGSLFSMSNWSFYVRKVPGDIIPLRSVSRAILPHFVDGLPGFLREFKEYLVAQTINTLASTKKAEQLVGKG